MATAKSLADPYAIEASGAAKDPRAFLEALRADREKMTALEAEPEVLKVVRGDDLQAFQELLRTVYTVS